jgi:hypothetical protein
MTLSQLLLACSLSCSALALSTAAHADNTPSKTTVKKVSKAKPAAKAAEAKPLDEEAAEPAINDASVTEFDCELGNKITIYENSSDDAHIALRWKKRLHRLTRVGTSTGAHRFENRVYGLVWIGIPAKGMLLDSKQGRQLANECRNAEQMKPIASNEAPATGASL